MSTFIINGSGSLVFRGIPGKDGDPGGTTGQIQYNDNGVLNGAPITTSPAGSLTSSADFLINGSTVGLGAGGDPNSTVLGVNALYSGGGSNNTAIGRDTLYGNTSGQYNVAVGRDSLRSNSNGVVNVGVGYSCLRSNTTGGYNVAIGNNALFSNNDSYNVGIGDTTMDGLTTGQLNIAIGQFAGSYYGSSGSPVNSISNTSIFIGNDARPAANNQTNQIVIGSTARGSGSNTTVIGNSSTTLTRLFGALALGPDSNYASAGTIRLGGVGTISQISWYGAGSDRNIIETNASGLIIRFSNPAYYTQVDGAEIRFNGPCLYGTSGTALTGPIRLQNNTFAYARNSTNASDIRIIGVDSSDYVSIGPSSYPVKISTLGNLTSSADFNINGVVVGRGGAGAGTNTAVGNLALSVADVVNINNSAFGYFSLKANTGNSNTAIGYQSLLSNTTGADNVAVGKDSLTSNTTGTNNVVLGSSAGTGAGTTPSDNIFIGYNSRPNSTNQSNQIVIGSNSNGSGSNTTTIGTPSTTATKLFGQLKTNGGIVGDAVAQGAVNGVSTQSMNDVNVIPATSVYQNSSIVLTSTGSLSSRWTVTLPAAADSVAYEKIIDNQTSGSFRAGITTGTGNVVDVASRQREIVLVDSRGVSKVTSGVNPQDMGLRLTLTSGTPITTSDVATSTTVYLSPYLSGRISLIYGGIWQGFDTNEVSLALGTVTSGRNYDVFAYWSGSAVVLELSAAWNVDNVTRTDALARQNGVLVKSSDITRRYIGTFRTISTTATTDTKSQRFLWNHYNQVKRYFSVIDSTNTWTYVNPNQVWRQANASTANKCEVVCGQSVPMSARTMGSAVCSAGTSNAATGIGIDSTTSNSSQIYGNDVFTTIAIQIPSHCETVLSQGYHAINWLETGTSNALTYTYVGDNNLPTVFQTGMLGSIEG